MELEQIVELIDRVSASELDSFCLEQNGMRLSLKKKQLRKQTDPETQSTLVQLQKQLENAKEQLAQPFAQADELAEKSKRLAELEALLNLNEKDIVLDTVPDEDQQCRSDNRQRGQER